MKVPTQTNASPTFIARRIRVRFCWPQLKSLHKHEMPDSDSIDSDQNRFQETKTCFLLHFSSKTTSVSFADVIGVDMKQAHFGARAKLQLDFLQEEKSNYS